MLFPTQPLPLDDATWRRINMRKISHLIGAESIHNLYNRHWPRINSLRFRHTITNFKDGIVDSYAPVHEWSYLQQWLSQKFVAADPTLLREIRAIMHPSYDLVQEIMDKVDNTDLKKLSNQELALLLIDIVDYPLGDIYKLNVVQIEYSLNAALHTLLSAYEPSAQDRNELLAQLLAPGELTVAQTEEVAFGTVLQEGREKGIADPTTDSGLLERIKQHHAKFSPLHCAYGEEPPILQNYVDKYVFMYSQDRAVLTAEDANANVAKQLQQSQKLLARLKDEKLTQLCTLMAEIGVFRDYNKAKLGETVVRRLKVLDEIARRTKVARDDLNYYLMAELTALLDADCKLATGILEDRKENGVCFVRTEEVQAGIQSIAISATEGIDETVMDGICASPGEVSGVAKIIRTKEDIEKVNPGDIMVAIGTDFDLLEIMNLSGGIITEEGGLLSHASVVSRELKKPCLIGVARATSQLHDGDMVRLEATEGKIYVLETQ